MASTVHAAASGSVFCTASADKASAGFDEALDPTSSHACGSADDYKILRPGDFKRVKSQLSLRSRPVSRIDFGSESLGLAASSSSPTNANESTRDASPLPPDFDLIIKNPPHDLAERESGDRATFGNWQDSDSSDLEEDAALAPESNEHPELSDELLHTVDESDAHPTKADLAAPTSSPRVHDAHLDQLKQEADQVWATYRSGMVPQQSHPALDLSLINSRTTRPQPAQIPERLTSLRRSSTAVVDAIPAAHSKQSRNSVATSSSQSHLSHVDLRSDVQTFPRITSCLSHGSLMSGRGPPSSDLHFHRPYTASIVSSTSEHSFLSYQHSFESGISPLLLHRAGAPGRLPGQSLRPVTSGSIPNMHVGASDFVPTRHTLPTAAPRPETSNQLTAEQRRQQVRRTKKLTHMLGEEMLLASNTLPSRTHRASVSSDLRGKHRPQSMAFAADLTASNPAFASITGNKTRTLSRKLLHSRSHGTKSLDRALCDMMMQPAASAPASLNRKAAAVLGIAHPYAPGAYNRASVEEMLASDEELDRLTDRQPRTFIPSGLEDFNEPTPKVAQLAAFSAAALDEGASPTLPQDGPFRAFDQSYLDQALAESESRKLAAARHERRRRVAKMSRWLGEAVPAELIISGAGQHQNTYIRSTEAPIDPTQSSISHESATYSASELGGTRRGPTRSSVSVCNTSNGHGSVSHEGSIVSNLQSFMSIESSDDESDHEPAPIVNCGAAQPQRRVVERRSVTSSPASVPSALPDRISAYRNSIDSWEYLLNTNDHDRLTELASIFHDTRTTAPDVATGRTLPLIARPPRSPARPRTSPAVPTIPLSHSYDGFSTASRPVQLSSGVGGVPRRSAAFLELTDSDSDSSDADDELHDIDDLTPCYAATLRQRRLGSHDRSISKLSNFFGSTPSQIVRSQSVIRAGGFASSSGDSDHTEKHQRATANGSKASQPDTLRHVLRSLEQEALNDSNLTTVQKSEISRKVHLLKKRTTKMFA